MKKFSFRNLFKRKKRGTLANVLLRNYILSYFIMTLILLLGIIITLVLSVILYFNLEIASLDNANTLMKDDYKTIDISNIEKLGGYMEIVDSNHKVIYRKGYVAHPVEYYTVEQYNKIFESIRIDYPDAEKPSFTINLNENNKEDFIYRAAYNKKEDFLLVLAIPTESFNKLVAKNPFIKPKHFLLISLFTGVSILVLFFVFFSRVTSKNFIKPLKILTQGAKKLSEGDYTTRIELKSENEFAELRDTFNSMVEKIQIEQNLREKSEENRRRLILDISHDLKNPLSSIMGYSDFLLKNTDLSFEESQKYLGVIHSNSQRANNLITDLFEFSKLESMDFKLTLKSSDICEFIRELIASYIPQLEEKNFHYDFEIPEESFYIAFDSRHLDRALSNIILNSLKYNSPNTSLTIKAAIKDPYFELIIKDDGIGIPKEMLDDIFSPFVRVDSSRNSRSGGTGLGLAISRSIIQKHGGDIILISDTNQGCNFKIVLKK